MLLASSTTTRAGDNAAAASPSGRGAGGEEEGALDDEALAWRLQEEMEREHLMALAGMLPQQRGQLGEEGGAALAAAVDGGEGGGEEGRAAGEEGQEQEEEGEEDPAALSYERLTALTDIVGVVPKKASTSALSKIVVGPYKLRKAASREGEKKDAAEKEGEEEEEEEQCAVCRVELEKGEDAATLPCGHAYHEGCVLAWLERAKSCPVCGVELEASL